MVDLMTWRAAIGIFCGKLQGGRNVYLKPARKVSDDTKTTRLSSLDIVVACALCWCALALANTFCETVGVGLSLESRFVSEQAKLRGTVLCVEEGPCVTDTVGHAAVREPGLLFALCTIHAMFSMRKLLLSHDVETNPGPDTDETQNTAHQTETLTNTNTVPGDMINTLMQAMQQQFTEHTRLIRNDLGEIKDQLGEVKQQCEEINRRCDRLENDQRHLTQSVTDMTTDIQQLFTQSNDDRKELQHLSDTISQMDHEINLLKENTDRLEDFSRRDNLRFYGIPQQQTKESFDACARAVADTINSVDGHRQWTSNDIARAHRTGQAREGQPRPMIVKFDRWRDKMTIITDRDMKQKLREKGIKVANDLTRAQAQIVADARREGKTAYFQRGRLVVGPGRDSRTFAQVVKEGDRYDKKRHDMTQTADRTTDMDKESAKGGSPSSFPPTSSLPGPSTSSLSPPSAPPVSSPPPPPCSTSPPSTSLTGPPSSSPSPPSPPPPPPSSPLPRDSHVTPDRSRCGDGGENRTGVSTSRKQHGSAGVSNASQCSDAVTQAAGSRAPRNKQTNLSAYCVNRQPSVSSRGGRGREGRVSDRNLRSSVSKK